jgi:hypothetical protein
MANPRSPALEALLDRFIDYAGMFPPATLAPDAAIANYERYRQGPHAWILRWLVVSADRLERVPACLDKSLAVLGDSDEPRAAVIESKRAIRAERPVYCEVATTASDSDRSIFSQVQRTGCFAKIRTGGVKPEMIPSVREVARFIITCAELRLPFKATAGLHHPIRAVYPLTYEVSPPRAEMHGFLNLLMAAALAWHGERDLDPVLSEVDPTCFRFDERAHWRDRSLDAAMIREARQHFIHSVGSCSFDEPVQGLQELGLL